MGAEKILTLSFFGLCVYIAINFEIANDGMLLAFSSLWVTRILILVGGCLLLLGIVSRVKRILND